MLIVGAKGFAKEVLEVIHQNNQTNNLVFYDDVNDDAPEKLYNTFLVLKTIEQAKTYFETVDAHFTIGVGHPKFRKMLFEKFTAMGGICTSTISKNSIIGSFGVQIGVGCNIMNLAAITNDVVIGKCVIINQLCSIGHDVEIGDFTEICPNVSISGNCTIGENVFIGTGAIVLPKIKIGQNSVIGAGSVVTKDVPENSLVMGIPGEIKKRIP